jgi:putative ABC transport system substrate-binding protein
VAELIRLRAAVIVVNRRSAHAAKAATTTVPIIFASGIDPVQAGLVAGLNRPGGNVTGVVWIDEELGGKRLDLLRQIVPKATTIGMLVEAERRDVQDAAQILGRQLIVLDASGDRDIETAFATSVQRGAGALLVGTGAFLGSHRERLVALAARHALPAISTPEFALAGGLMGYGTSKRCLSSSRYLRRTDSQGGETGRPAGNAINQIRSRHQPQDRQGPRPHHPGNAAGHG